MTSRARIGLFLAFCSSVGVHGVAYASLSGAHRTSPRSSVVSEVNFELPPLPAAEPIPEPEPPQRPSEPAPKAPVALPRRQPESAPVKSPATATPKAATAAPALDLSGVTLTNDSGAGFAMPTGDGSALHGPIGPGADRAQAQPAAKAVPSAPKLPAVVDIRDLTEHPRPPSLTDLLRANYPEEARARGLRGTASLRARIDADGVIRSVRLLSESTAGFGSACRRTVLGSRWSAPRDKNGSAVATEIVYTCRFEVDH